MLIQKAAYRLEKNWPSRILLIHLAFIGDVILATPVVRALKTAYPDATITMLTVPVTAEVAAMNPYVDDVIIYDKCGKDKGLLAMWKMARRLKQQRFDLAICMNFAVRGAMLSWLAGIPRRLGYDAQHAGWFLTDVQSSRRDSIKHERLNHLEILRPLRLRKKCQDTSLELTLPMEAGDSLRQKLETYMIPSNYMIICPCGNNKKRELPVETVAEVIKALQKKIPVYLIGGNREACILQKMAQRAGLNEKNVLAGVLNLQELAIFIQSAEFMLTVDTGPLHIAQAVKCPVVAVFGPADPIVWGPCGAKDIVIYHPLDCSPCWNKGTCEVNECIRQITADEILQALDRLSK